MSVRDDRGHGARRPLDVEAQSSAVPVHEREGASVETTTLAEERGLDVVPKVDDDHCDVVAWSSLIALISGRVS